MTDLQGTEIAIIGMASRFPGAHNPDEFWRNLRDGVESIRFLDDQELQGLGIDPTRSSSPNYIRAAADLDGIQLFDAAFFGYTPRDAELMDPQHRLFLECAWEALEHAGCVPDSYPGAIGVFAGTMLSTYLLYNLFPNRNTFGLYDPVQVTVSNGEDFLTTRVSYNLNLRGPSFTVQTACSTSLVAVHLACQSLLNNECDAALAGGACVQLKYSEGYHYTEGGMSSPDGHTRTFDAQASGTIFGNGVGLVVLKRLEDALADGDSIFAVIKGSAINNDGAVRVGYTAPGVEGQTTVIAEALAVAGVEPDEIDYVEAHGTATRMGDSIEFQAMREAFSGATAKNYCAVGSVKTNIGHLAAAAGVAGLIKTTLAIKHGQIPPSLHFERPSPELDFANSPFFINNRLAEWPRHADRPRRAGVSSFGLGGTNAHVVLEEAPALATSASARPQQLLTLSAKTASALDATAANLARFLREHPEANLADVAYTLQTGRAAFGHRRVVVARDPQHAADVLEGGERQRLLAGVAEMQNRPVAFLFPGMGDQYANMALELYRTEPVFREQIDRCAEILRPLMGLDPRDVLYPADTHATNGSNGSNGSNGAPQIDLRKLLRRDPNGQANGSAAQLSQTALAHPIIFMVEYALAQLWMAWGIRPQTLIGHSIGEYAAACLAGVFSLEDALLLVARRAQLIEQLPSGAMLAVMASEEQVLPLLGEQLSLAAVNAPLMCVVSGETEAVAGLERLLLAQGVACQRVQTQHAFHSAMMAPLEQPLRDLLGQVALRPPATPLLSTVTGTWMSAADATDPAYWARHMRQTVRFADGLAELLKTPEQILLEVGPGLTLSTLVTQRADRSPEQAVLNSLRHPHDAQSDVAFLLTTLGRLWLAGAQVNWPALYTNEQRRRTPLPTYPFERQRYWIEEPAGGQAAPLPVEQGKRANIADWFFVPSWQQTPPLPPAALEDEPRRWLVFADQHGLGLALAERLRALGQTVVTVAQGEAFGRAGDGGYTLNPQSDADYETLVRDLAAGAGLPDVVAHAWSLTAEAAPSTPARFAQAQDEGYYSLLFLTRALALVAPDHSARIGVVANQVYAVSASEPLAPEKVTLLGPCKVIPQEHAGLACVCVDVELPRGPRQRQQLVDSLIAELAATASEVGVAYRGGRRWLQHYVPTPLAENAAPQRPLRDRGVYWIIGGLGNVGYVVAEHLARAHQARLVLSGRAGLPPRDEWAGILASRSADDQAAQAIRQIQSFEALGAEVLVLAADVADEAQMRAALAQIDARFGALHGVLHIAGVTSGPSVHRALAEMGRAESETQFQPKIYGLYVLERVLEGRALDFQLLFSSSSAVLGGLGFVAYTAAHCFMDAFATTRSQTSAAPWVSADWDLWPTITKRGQGLQSSFDQYAMSPWEGQEAFRRVASLAPEGQVLVITGDLQARIDLWLRRKESKRGPAAERHQRPALSHQYVAPQSATERALAEIWSSVLGIEQIGADDNFFELGGHSLLLPQIINGLRQAFGIELPVRQLFEHTTVASLAALIDSGGGQASDADGQLAERIRAAFPTERPELVKTYVAQKIALALGIDARELAADGRLDRFDSEAYALDLLVHLKEDFKIQAFAPEVQRIASVEAMTRFVLTELDRVTDMARLATTNPLSAYTLQPYRKHASEQILVPAQKNRPLALVLSAPRSGSTIFRVMLAGHPQLFCPPELYLMHFETMREWDQNVGFGDSLAWNRQGLEWAYSELKGIGPEESQAHVSRLVEQNTPVYRVYAELQELAGDRLLVDKSPTYALDPEALVRADRFFDRPKYIHLIRHPYTVMQSILQARLDTLLGPNLFKESDVDPYVVAETIWAASNRTLLQFLADAAPEQRTSVRYEELVSDSARVMTELCAFLGIPFDESVLNPYDNTQKRMAGGIGDPNIFKHKSINPQRGEAWRSISLPRYLDESTRRVAAQLSYELPGEQAAPTSEALPPTNLDGLSDEEVDRMLNELLEKEGN